MASAGPPELPEFGKVGQADTKPAQRDAVPPTGTRDSASAGPGTVVETIPVPAGAGPLAYVPGTNEILVGDGTTGNVTAYNASTYALVGNLTLDSTTNGPGSMAVDPALDELFATVYGIGVVAFNASPLGLNGSFNSSGDVPSNLAFDPEAGDLFMANGAMNNTTVVQAASHDVIAQVAVGLPGSSLLYDPLVDRVFETFGENYPIGVIDPVNDSLVATVPLNNSSSAWLYPAGMTLDSQNGYVYVACFESPTVLVLDAAAGEIVGDITVPEPPAYVGSPDVVYDSWNGYVYASERAQNYVAVINPANGSAFASIHVSAFPNGFAFDPANGTIFVEAGNYVNVIATARPPPPSLTGVSVTPVAADIDSGASDQFNATAACGGSTCPPTVAFTWSLSNGLGSLNATSGSSVTFLAGRDPGIDEVNVSASLNGSTGVTASANVTIRAGTPILALISVSISSVESVSAGGSVALSATPRCSGGSCPAGVEYGWSSNPVDGSFNPTTGATTMFTVGSVAGSLELTVEASWNGSTVSNSTSITVSAAPGTSAGVLGLPGSDGYYLIGGLAVAAVAGVAAFLMIRRRKLK